MKRTTAGLVAVAVVAVVLAGAVPVAAHDYDRDNSDHVLRYVAYLLHPVGIALEYGVTRPIHWVVSQPNLRTVFGHAPRHERDAQGLYPVCNLCQPGPQTEVCPSCHRPILKPRDEYWPLGEFTWQR
ncbi:hypothetical protein AMJ85_02100 [candidate division BRC1 bacterium SM23_51]|nr:MAG: hypothetical protein AMJ85_02100 [candidate division BRC1 bacterium SM23_51]